jgi:uncharacterized protein YjdB
LRLVTMVGALALGQAACGSPYEPGGQGPSTDIVPVEGVRVTPQSVLLTALGETRQLSATIDPDDATDQQVTWVSSDTSVATVNAVGLVTARAAGLGVFITAVTRDGHHEATANVGVDPTATVVPVEGVKVTPQSVVMTVIGETRQLIAAVGPETATDKVVVWESTDTAVATVDATGLVTARGIGAGVFITAVTHDGHFQSSANVSVNP